MDGSGEARPLVTLPAAVLREAARPAPVPDPGLRPLADDLVATMRAARGLGVAAPQVGVSTRVAVVAGEAGPLLLVNPAIIARRGRQVGWEGCLSVPHLLAEGERSLEVTVETDDLDGTRRTLRATGLAARAIEHEVDHLDGRVYLDLVPPGSAVDTREHPTPPRGGPYHVAGQPVHRGPR
jgi:peptide deformylase